jgi:hypothetical protein
VVLPDQLTLDREYTQQVQTRLPQQATAVSKAITMNNRIAASIEIRNLAE